MPAMITKAPAAIISHGETTKPLDDNGATLLLVAVPVPDLSTVTSVVVFVWVSTDEIPSTFC